LNERERKRESWNQDGQSTKRNHSIEKNSYLIINYFSFFYVNVTSSVWMFVFETVIVCMAALFCVNAMSIVCMFEIESEIVCMSSFFA
jgi:hypothetical protein